MTPERLAEVAAAAYQHMTPWSAAQFRETLARPDAVLVAEGDAFVLGVVQFDTAEILALACAPQTQRQGLARRALTRFAATVAERGATQIILEVSEHNTPAISLYETTGFTQIGRRKGYYTAPGVQRADALVLQCRKIQPSTTGSDQLVKK